MAEGKTINRSAIVVLIFVFALSLGLRLQGAMLFPAQPVADSADYHRLAVALVSGKGYVDESGSLTAWRPPGYPFFVAGVYSITGVGERRAYVVQAILSSLTVLMVMAFACFTAGRREALVAGLIAAVYPGFFWLPRVLLSENLSLFLLLVALVITIKVGRDRGWLYALVLGAVLGASILVRGANLFVALLLLLGIAFTHWTRKVKLVQSLSALSLVVIGIVLVMTPWTIRNYHVFHRFVPIATQDGMAFYSSYWPPQEGQKLIWGNLAGKEDPTVAAALRSGDEVAVSEYLRAATWSKLRETPGRFFQLLPAKMIALLAPFDWEWFPHGAGKTRSTNFGYVLILPPALVGALVLLRRRALDQWTLLVPPISVLAQALVFYGSPRFRLPAEVSAVVIAAVGICWLIKLIR